MTMMPPVAHDALGCRHALDRLVEVAVERVAAVGRHDEVEGRVAPRAPPRPARGRRRHRGLTGSGPANTAVTWRRPVDGDVDARGAAGPARRRRGRSRAPGCRRGSTKVARASAMRRGWWASRIVVGGGQSRADRLGPAAEAGEEVRLDEAGDDAHVGLDVLALQQHRASRRPRPPRTCARSLVRVVVDDGVARHDVGPDELLHLRRRWPGGGSRWRTAARSRSSGTPQRASSASSGGSTVRFGMGRVRSGKTTATRPALRQPASAQRRPAQRAGAARPGSHAASSAERRLVDRDDRPRRSRAPRPTSRGGRRPARRAPAQRTARGRARGATRWPPAPTRPRGRPCGRRRPVDLDRGGVRRDHRLDRVELVEREPHAERLARPAARRRPTPPRPSGGAVAGTPRTDVRTSTHTGRPDPAPPSVTPSAVRAAQAPHRHHLHAAQHVPGDRLDHGAGQVGGAVGRAQTHEAGPGVVAPPRGTGAVEPRHGDHAACAGRALRGQRRQLVGAAAEQAAQPGQERAGGGQAALEQPAPVRGAGHHGTGRRGHRALVHRHRHVGRWCPSSPSGGPRRRPSPGPRTGGRRRR